MLPWLLRGQVASRLASFQCGHGAAKSGARQVVLRVVLTDVRRHCRCQCPAITGKLRGCCAAKLRVVSQVSSADMARPSPAQGKLSCKSSRRTFDGIAAASARPLPGSCAAMPRDILPAILPDIARPSRCHLAGLRAAIGELLASRKNLVESRGKAYHAIACELDWPHRDMIWELAGLSPGDKPKCKCAFEH
jgi:hypothetical protein